MEDLIAFLENHEDHEAWLLIPPGLITGTLGNAPLDAEKDNLKITNVTLFSGCQKIFLEQITVRINQIYSWGEGLPRFIDND